METKEKLGQEPAFPNESNAYMQMPDCFGMSKRFFAACLAMNGIMSNNECRIGHIPQQVAELAYSIADEMLRQENV